MAVDSSAVSRLEKGERSLRVAECVLIAEVLNMGIENLLRGVQTPAQRIRETIRDADLELASAQRNLWRWLAYHYDAKLTLERLPELLKSISPELESAEEYLPMVAKKLRHYSFRKAVKPSEHHLGVRDETDKRQLLECVNAYFDHLILINRHWPQDMPADEMWDLKTGDED
jgi:hypothetical protein